MIANSGEKATATPATSAIMANLRVENWAIDLSFINKVKRIGKMKAIAIVPIRP